MTPDQPKLRDSAELTRRTTRSAAWLILVRLASKGVDFLSLLILAKLLSPTDFGIIAIAMTLVLMIEAIFELPVSQVLVSMPLVTDGHIDTAFTLSALRGLALALVLWILAIPFASFYHDPRLASLIGILSCAPVLRGMISPRMSFFIKRLDFRRDLILDLGNKLATLASSSLAAWLLHDYRALMVGIIVSPLVVVILSYVFAPYRPRFSLRNWSAFSGFVGWTTISQFLSAVNWQCDRLLLGRFVTPAALGNYSLANDLSFLPEQALIKPIVRPLLSAFSLIGDDIDRLRSAYHRASGSIFALGLPLMLGLSLLADPAVHFILGSKWVAAIPTLQWLSLTLIPPLFISPFPSLAMARGRFDLILRQTASEAASKIPLMAIGALLFGIPGAIGARAISSIITSIFVLYYTGSILNQSISRQILGIWRILASGLILAAFLLLTRPLLAGDTGLTLGLHLWLVSIAGLTVYCVSLVLLWISVGRPRGIEELIWNRILVLLRRKFVSR
ncbi:MAG: lipopolysaccharide biosynthesis protein [Sphingomonadales bacterium]|nr:lipopolysaccharide biosynthesis protein [Sphingomonadales bacterium]